MKKGALLAILFGLLLTCTACGKKEPANDPQTDATTTTTAAADNGSTTTAVGEVGIEDLIPTTGKPVTRVVTEKGGKTVTDKEKKPVTEVVTRVVTDKDNKTVTDKSKQPVTEIVTEPVTTAPTQPTASTPTTTTTKPTTTTTKKGETAKVGYDDNTGWSPIKPVT